MFSNLSAGVKNAPEYNQAARNVACMAEVISRSGLQVEDIDQLDTRKNPSPLTP